MDRKRYNLELLQSFVKDNEVELIGNYENVNRETRISGKCSTLECEETFCKGFYTLLNKGGSYCEKCTEINKIKKSKKTFLEKYGVDHNMKSEEVKEKIKQTCLEKYGVENPMQSEEVKEKHKKACLRNNNCEYPMQSETIKEKSKQTCLRNNNCEYPMQSETIKEKSKQKCLKKYKVEHPMQSEEVKEKSKQKCFKNHGVKNPSQCEKIKDKKKQTCLKNYGCEYSFQNERVKEKIKRTCLKNYGCEYSFQNEGVKEKIKRTCLKNYGVEHPSQNSEICEKQFKNSFNKKEYILPSGKIIQVQGYEDLALDILIYHENIDENDIMINRSEVPEIWYDYNGKYHRYYVDIFIKPLNKCIEVKSEYTFNTNKKINLLKHKYVKYNGYNSEIWIFDDKKTLIKVIE